MADLEVYATGALMTAGDFEAANAGDSFYIVDVNRFERTCRRFVECFRSIYSRSAIGYSYKTNYLPQLIRVADSLGAYSEVVSRFEFDFAERLGIPGSRTIFNGPIKRREDLEHAIDCGAILNVDSILELCLIGEIARGRERQVSVGIRCFLGANTPDSRFGIDVEDPEAVAVLRSLDDLHNVRISGLHCHFSGGRRAEHYARTTAALIDVHERFLGGREIDYIDVGGGFASAMSPFLARQFSEPPPSFQQYAEAIAGEMLQRYGTSGPELILEPGMGVLADCMEFVTRVNVLKKLGERSVAVVDGSVFNVKPLRGALNLPIRVVPGREDRPRQSSTWDLVGHTCMEVDVLHTGYQGSLAVGDWIVVENVGAYTNVLNAPFIRGTPPIVERDAGGAWRLLRRESTTDDLLRSYADDS